MGNQNFFLSKRIIKQPTDVTFQFPVPYLEANTDSPNILRNVLHNFAQMYGNPCCYDHLQVLEYFFNAISAITPPFLDHDSRIFILIFLHSS